jgi:hypothetical protein
LTAKSGSLIEIHDRCCHGLSASSASHRRTVDAETATWQRMASSRASSGQLHFDNATSASAGRAHASAMTSARSAALNTGGRPLRGASRRPGSRSAVNRARHFRTVSMHTPNLPAIAAFVLPEAAMSTIRARRWSRYSLRTEQARAAKTVSSSSDRTITYGLDIDM